MARGTTDARREQRPAASGRARGREPGRAATTVRVPVAMAAENRSAAWLRNFRLSGFAFAILLLIVAALVVLAPALKTYVQQREQISQLEKQVAQAKGDVTDLSNEAARWNDPAYVEAEARSRLYYVYPGEVSYLVTGVPDATPATTTQPISDTIQDTRFDWLTSLLGSVYTAGTTTQTPQQLTKGGSGG